MSSGKLDRATYRRATVAMISLFGTMVLHAGCGGTAPVAAPSTSIGPTPDPAGTPLAEAREVVARFAAQLAEVTPPSPLDAPNDLDDVLAVLRTDQVSLFPAAIERASEEDSIEAKALVAQLELAWGEAQFIAAHLLRTATSALDRAVGDMLRQAAAGGADEETRDQLRSVRESVADAEQLAAALELVAADHVGRGAELTEALLDNAPDHYLGYRLAADYYRLRHQWEQFDQAITELERIRPTSTGLKFLRGAAAFQRDSDEDRAEEILREALREDPEFTRAQVQVLFAQDSVWEMHNELANLEEINAHHQLVVWVGPVIRLAFRDYRRRQEEAAQRRETQVREHRLDEISGPSSP